MRVCQALLQAVKEELTRQTTTGLTGVLVHENPRPVLIALYEKTLQQLQIIPESSPYYVSAQTATKKRLALVRDESSSISDLEERLGEGPIEMAIKQAEAELSLAQKMEQWRPWDALETPPPAGQWQFAFKQR